MNTLPWIWSHSHKSVVFVLQNRHIWTLYFSYVTFWLFFSQYEYKTRTQSLITVRAGYHCQGRISPSGQDITVRPEYHRQARISPSGQDITVRAGYHRQSRISPSGQNITVRPGYQSLITVRPGYQSEANTIKINLLFNFMLHWCCFVHLYCDVLELVPLFFPVCDVNNASWTKLIEFFVL
jgi:hypothetical protein